MGNCLKSKKESEKKLSIVLSIFGLDDSGKTTTASILKGAVDELSDITPTLGFAPHEFKYNSNDILMNDLGGGERLRDIWKHYLAESFGFIWVIDSSNITRIEECRNEFTKFIENEKVFGKPILILANKQDKQNSLDESDIVTNLRLNELVNKNETPCRVETCRALNDKLDPSIKTGFDWLIKFIELDYEKIKERVSRDTKEQREREARFNKDRFEKVREKRKEQEERSNNNENDYTQINRDFVQSSRTSKPSANFLKKNNRLSPIHDESGDSTTAIQRGRIDRTAQDGSPWLKKNSSMAAF